jgi:hypothetical protein
VRYRYRHAHRQHGDLINVQSFFQNKESRLKMDVKEKAVRVWTKFKCLRIGSSGDLI